MPPFARMQRASIVLMLCWGAAASGATWVARGSSHAELHTAAYAAVRLPAHARSPDSASAFDHAERMREALEGRPQAQRTRAAYERVLDAYRAIYHGDPAGPRADAAMDAVASLLAEEGRTMGDPGLLQAAITQYEYLRSNHPGSPFRQSALLSEAEIEESDLHDDAASQRAFADFLKEYPHSPLAGEARQQLKAISRHGVPAMASAPATTYQVARDARPKAAAAGKNSSGTTAAAREHARQLAELNAMPAENASATPRTTPPRNAWPVPAGVASPPNSTLAPYPGSDGQASDGPAPNGPVFAGPAAGAAVSSPMKRLAGSPILITGIRHWSTPVYTRVAIDLSDQVQFEAARVPNPDRIFFDLHGARLAPELIGRSVDVTDDGYLKRVRVAQYSATSTRIVLDVSHVSEYSAFFLPNPWRLIIDIHGAANNGSASTLQAANGMPAAGAADGDAKPAAGAVQKPNPMQKPNAVQPADAAPLQEVATLGHQPDRVKATTHPTTSPIAASVTGTTRAAQPNELQELDGSSQSPNSGPAQKAGSGTETTAASAGSADATTSLAAKRTRRHSAAGTLPVTTTDGLPAHLAPEIPSAGAREATPTSSGERSLVRALGLKIGRIVIDAGHGGHDSGTLGPGGIEEKDVVLDVALRLGKLLKQRLGSDVIYTRDDDTFIPLETRTAIANKAQADLFISVHANSSSDSSARGVEVYYLNFTTSPEALEVAARENAVSDQSIYQLSDLVKKITLKDKIDESHEFAANVESSLYNGLAEGNPGLKDRGVKKAPFVVLIGANMPSILAEISFLTNPDDARELRDPAYRERIAASLYRGIEKYVSGLSGVRLAQTGGRTVGQQ